jgi:hypothetical protein
MNKIHVAIWFGNRKGRDVDILLILNNDSPYGHIFIDNPKSILSGKCVDVTYIGKYWVNTLLYNLDPLITEPFLHGKVIYGINSFIGDHVNEMVVRNHIPNYLYSSAKRYYKWTLDLIKRENVKEAFANLVFIYSYLALAVEYKNSNNVLSFKSLIKKDPQLQKIRSRSKDKKPITLEEFTSSQQIVREKLFGFHKHIVQYQRVR